MTGILPIVDEFARRFGHASQWSARAPGRVNLIGEHTDYNGGWVLPMAIDRETRVLAAPNGLRRAVFHSMTVDESVSLDLDAPLTPDAAGGWGNYVRGVIAGFQRLDWPLAGFDAVVDTTVPVGSGLSSSAALEVAIATLLEVAAGRTLDPLHKAGLCRTAEHEFAGVPCGMMDQAIAVLGREGHLLRLDCATGATQWVPFDDPSIAVLVIDTRVRHALADGAYARRRAECRAAADALGVEYLCAATMQQLAEAEQAMDSVVARRARHVISEQQRSLDAVAAIEARDWPRLGATLYASHVSLRDDFEVSCAELDAVVEAARAVGLGGGVYGCRMTGGGFGGCAVAVVDAARAEQAGVAIVAGASARQGFDPVAFVTHAAQGATASLLRHEPLERP